MSLTKQQKKEVINSIQDSYNKRSHLIFCDFSGVSVSQLQDLRKKLREAGAKMLIVKKTLLKRALNTINETKKVDTDSWKGSVSVTFAPQGAIEVEKALNDFANEQESFKILGGLFEGDVMDASGVTTLASIPGREQLLGNLVGLLNEVPVSFVRVLNGVQRNFVLTLDAIAKKN